MASLTVNMPIELMAAQVDSEVLTLPTGAKVFSRGSRADSIYGVRRGIIEVIGQVGEKLCYRPGELFSYEDIVWRDCTYRNDAIARTPVELLKLDRLRFLNLLHQCARRAHCKIKSRVWQCPVLRVMQIIQDIDAATKSHLAIDHTQFAMQPSPSIGDEQA